MIHSTCTGMPEKHMITTNKNRALFFILMTVMGSYAVENENTPCSSYTYKRLATRTISGAALCYGAYVFIRSELDGLLAVTTAYSSSYASIAQDGVWGIKDIVLKEMPTLYTNLFKQIALGVGTCYLMTEIHNKYYRNENEQEWYFR